MLTIVIITISLSLISYTYSELSAIKGNELKIAYANGYIAALQLDFDEIEILKKNKKLLKLKVTQSSTEYLGIITEMNK